VAPTLLTYKYSEFVFLTVCSVVMQIRSIVSCHVPAIRPTVIDAL